MKGPGLGEAVSPSMGVLLLLVLWMGPGEVAAAGTVARELPGGEEIELEIPSDIGPQKEIISLYHSGQIRYFSAGIGRAEREALYPPFPLKVVFTAGGKPFVAGVALSLRNVEGTTVLTVPGEQITGPWLFIDVPEGTYEITARLGGEPQQVKGIKVRRGHTTVQHIRWTVDKSPPLAAPAE